MRGAAPYEFSIKLSADVTQEFSHEFVRVDGTSLPLSDYLVLYSVGGRCGGVTLSQFAGITVNGDVATFSLAAVPLGCGVYDHECRLKHIATGKIIPAFDGTLTIEAAS